MPVYRYMALDAAGKEARGTLTADTPSEARQSLRSRALSILEFESARVTKWKLPIGLCSSHRRREQIAEIARYLSLLIRAGVPLTDSLDVLTRKRTGKLAAVLEDIRDRVSGGASLAEAFAQHEDWFDALFVSAIRVGELSGQLDEALTELATYLQASQKLRHQLTAALTYPVILVCLGTAVVLFLMSFVIPQLLTVLTASGRPLPASTMLVKGMADLLINHWLLLLGLALTAVTAGAALYRREESKRWLHGLQLRVPVLGSLIQKNAIAQFAQQMSLLLRTGIPFVEALRSVRALTHHRVLREELGLMEAAITSGSDIAPTMETSRVFPPVVTQVVAVGQSSGELTEMLHELRQRFETEVGIALTRFTAVLEPLLIVILAAAVGFVVFACLMPILEATRGIV